MEARTTQDIRKKIESVQAEELLSRFRSKEDLYRYLIHQGIFNHKIFIKTIVGLFLPSMAATKISFMRDIMKEQKLALK